jgi:hypothetical protein
MECSPKSAASAYGQPGRLEQFGCAYQFHPVRRCGPAKQCLWLGPGGYPCRSGRPFAIADAYSYGNSDGDANCNSVAECNSHSYTYGNNDALTYGDSDSYAQGKAQTSADSASAAVSP